MIYQRYKKESTKLMTQEVYYNKFLTLNTIAILFFGNLVGMTLLAYGPKIFILINDSSQIY